MERCSHCGAEHDADTCPATGKPLSTPGPCGTRIDRYEVLERIGSGGFGTVYRARHAHTLREVALKLLDPDLATDSSALARFKREAQVAASIHSRHVVEVLDWGVLPNGSSFLVMELLAGRDLAAVLRAEGKLGVAPTLELAKQILAGLAAIHRAGAIHRDLKPANVFLAREEDAEVVKLLDLGACRLSHRELEPVATRTGVTIGTPVYMSPEQLRGGDLDARSDVYSAAVVIYELLAGRRPHAGTTYEDHVARVCSEDPAPLDDVPEQVAAAILRGLDRGAPQRWPSADAFARALRGEPPSDSAATRPVAVTPPPIAPSSPADPTLRSPRTEEPVHRTPRRAVAGGRWLPIAGITALALLAGAAIQRALSVGADAKPASAPATTTAAADAPDAPDARDAADAPAASEPTPAAAAPTAEDTAPVDRSEMGTAANAKTCTSNTDCPQYRCECRNAVVSGGECLDDHCPSAAKACAAGCARYGGWSGRHSVLYATGAADCASSPECRSEGKCKARREHPNFGPGIACVRSCRDLVGCARLGRCTDVGGESLDCTATSDADCAASHDCIDRGACSAVNGACVPASDADCHKSEGCREYGRCTLVGDDCGRGSDAGPG